MKSSPLARRQLRNHARYRGRNDLNIVPMLDVMVILAFFLIFTAVFSKTSILEVHLPGPGAKAAPQVPVLELEVIVRRGGLEIADRNSPGASMHDVASTLGVAPTTIQLWEYGTNEPAGDNVDRLVALTGDDTLPARWTRWLSRRPS